MGQLAAFVFSELAEASATLAGLGEARSERARLAYLDIVREAVVSTGGRELTAAGDGVLAAFESASDALLFARRVQRGCERESRRSSERLDVRLGIDVGEAPVDEAALAADSGAADRARRLARAAESAGVLASSLVPALAVDTDARFAPVGLLDLRDSAAPVSAVEVTWERPVAAQVPLPPEVGRSKARATPFVGRAAERERLRAAWQLARTGERQLALVAGEPGIGKTRLLAELARELHEQGAAVLWGRSAEEALSPYQPFVQALEHHVRCASPEELREQVGGRLGSLVRLLPELGLRLGEPPAPVGEPEGERLRLFEAVGLLLGAVSAEHPLLLVLDDLQWADRGTLLLLKHVARDPAPAPLLVVGAYRDSEVGPDHPLAAAVADVERDRVVGRIGLLGLDEDEVTALVGFLTGREPRAELVRSLGAETEGNPFFLEEMVRQLEELGLADPERLAGVESTAGQLGVPSRVRELVGRRVRRLSAPARSALAAASVLGGEFDRDLLAEVLEPGAAPDLVGALDEAVGARLLEEVAARIGRYRFSHGLVQQALYGEQTLNRRAALHERAAAAVERLHPEAPDRFAEIAHHYRRAGERNATKVVRYARAAGERALALLAYEDAVRDLSTALSALDLVAGEDDGARGELLALLGTAQTRAGEGAAARAAFRGAAAASAAAGAWKTLAAAALGYGGGTHFGGVWDAGVAIDAELVRLLEQALAACPPGDSPERVRLLGRLAQALYWSPETERAGRLSQEALAAARRLGDPAALAYALDSRNVVLWRPDRLDERRASADEMLRLGRAAGDLDIQLESLCWLITDALERGSLSVVDERVAEHARLAEELRQPYHLWFTQALRVMRAHLDGRLDEAEELCEQAHAYGLRVHEANAVQVYMLQRLFLSLDQGRAEEVLESLDDGPPVVAGSSAVVWRAAKALTLAGLDRREEALEEVARLAQQGFASIPRDCLWMIVMLSLGRTVGHFDDPAHADELYALLLPFADRTCVSGGPVLCLGPVSRVLGMLARAGGRPDDALGHLADSLERSHALHSPALVARTELEAAKSHLLRREPGDDAAAERLLERAAAAASKLGMAKLRHDVDALRRTLDRGALA